MADSKPNPFHPKPTPLSSFLLSPTSVGTITAAALALSPSVLGRQPTILQSFPKALSKLPPTVVLLLLGFPVGYAAAKSADWARWKVVQRLLAYQGWVSDSRSMKTKVWAVMLKLLQGQGSLPTYAFQRQLPRLPLPDLDDTLDLWLKVSSQFVSREELEQTKDVVERFRQNEGPTLQKYLQSKADDSVNWMSEYWLTAAYLSSREPLPISSNYYLVSRKCKERTTDQLAKAANSIKTFMDFYELVEQQKLPPIMLQDLVPLCMNGYRYIFNSARLPGEHIDRIQRYPGETHMVILRNGHYYQLEMFTSVEGRPNQKRLLTAEEIKVQLVQICQHADALPRPLPVAALTTLNRTKWAKLRERLMEKNEDILKCVESSLGVVYIEEDSPKDQNEICQLTLAGRGHDRWFDKCFSAVSFTDCTFGCNVEHSGIDAMVFGSLAEYFMLTEKFVDGDVPKSPRGPSKSVKPAKHMTWNVDDLKDSIQQAYDAHRVKADNLELHILNTTYGKGFMKKNRISPDGYIQMALQLAFYRLHKEIPKTYEPSTARLYALGRTENIHPVSRESRTWVRMMDDPECTRQSRKDLLRRSVDCQSKARLDATIGHGCDRHLLGLYCASRELGMDIPGLFMDKAWTMSFKLSTSQTPTRTVELGADVEYEWVTGGFGPSCEDGYGVSYVNMGEKLNNFAITSFKSSGKTSAKTFAVTLEKVLEDMKALFV